MKIHEIKLFLQELSKEVATFDAGMSIPAELRMHRLFKKNVKEQVEQIYRFIEIAELNDGLDIELETFILNYLNMMQSDFLKKVNEFQKCYHEELSDRWYVNDFLESCKQKEEEKE